MAEQNKELIYLVDFGNRDDVITTLEDGKVTSDTIINSWECGGYTERLEEEGYKRGIFLITSVSKTDELFFLYYSYKWMKYQFASFKDYKKIRKTALDEYDSDLKQYELLEFSTWGACESKINEICGSYKNNIAPMVIIIDDLRK